jgi:hypothetical protein
MLYRTLYRMLLSTHTLIPFCLLFPFHCWRQSICAILWLLLSFCSVYLVVMMVVAARLNVGVLTRNQPVNHLYGNHYHRYQILHLVNRVLLLINAILSYVYLSINIHRPLFDCPFVHSFVRFQTSPCFVYLSLFNHLLFDMYVA